MKAPLRSLSIYNTATTQWSAQKCSGLCQWEMYLNGKRERSVQNKMYPWKNKILICMDFTFITHLYNLAFSKHLPAYSLTCLYCVILFLSYILVPKHEISSYLQTSLYTISQFLSMPNRLDYALRTQNKKRNALYNCLAIYERPFRTWWDTNYIAHVQKQNKQKRIPASQTWPKRLDTAWHNLPKLVRRIRSS